MQLGPFPTRRQISEHFGKLIIAPGACVQFALPKCRTVDSYDQNITISNQMS